MEFFNKIDVLIEGRIGPVIGLRPSPLNDDVGFVVESISYGCVVLLQEGLSGVNLHLQISDP